MDIDETLISVRRWIDEVQIGQQVHHISTSTLADITDIHKQVTVLYEDNGLFQNMSFHFTAHHPFETVCFLHTYTILICITNIPCMHFASHMYSQDTKLQKIQ